MSKRVRLFFDRKKKATKDMAGAVEIVICLQRERTYIYSGIRVFKDQWKDGAIVKHPRAVPLNEDLQSQIEKYEKILIAMEVNGDEMRIRNFKSYLTYDGGILRNFMPWMRERIENRVLREGTRKILERNNYKLEISSNQKYNQFIKGIGMALECDFPLTSHVARHIFACTIVLGEGIPKEVLQVMMGHQMTCHIFNALTVTEVNTQKRTENLTLLIFE